MNRAARAFRHCQSLTISRQRLNVFLRMNECQADFSLFCESVCQKRPPLNFILQQHLQCAVSEWRGEETGGISRPAITLERCHIGLEIKKNSGE